MKKLVILFIGLTNAYFLIAQNYHDQLITSLDQLLEQELSQDNIHNIYLSVYAPSHNFEWHSAKGTFKDGREVTLENPFYTASIGKTFTATAIGILVDQGEIHFDDPISDYLPDEIMNGLHLLNGVNYSDSIKVAHLLQHTSGLPDYFAEETVDGSPSIFDMIISAPDRYWEPNELISFSKEHFKPYFAPGTGYHYTDTEYVLLGLIIENIGGIKFHEFLNKYIFKPLEMHFSYLNQRSEGNPSKAPMAEMYASAFEISTYKSLSADWAGGAIVSTGEELIKLMEALMNGDLVSESTLKAMQQWTYETQGMSYGYGLRKIDFQELASNLPHWEAIGHSGANGSFMYYFPDLDIYLTGTMNQLEASKEAVRLMIKVLMQCTML